MANARPPGGQTAGGPQLRLGVDLSQLRAAPGVAREAGRATAREISQAFRSLQNEQRIALEQTRQTTAVLRAQQSQITATTRAEANQRTAVTRAESLAQQQEERRKTIAFNEEEKRRTATHRSEIRAREAAARAEARSAQGGSFSLAGVGREALGAVGIGLGVAGAIDLARQVDTMARASAQADRTRASFDRLATGAGQSSQAMLQAMRQASRGMVADADLVQAANRAMMLEVADNAEEMAQLLEVARVRGQALGLSTTDAFNDIVTGIGRLSPMILDNLGIITDAERTYADYARRLGRTADSLTDAERRQALLNRVVEESQPLIEASGNAAGNAADKYERLDTAQANFNDAAGRFAGDAGQRNVEILTRLTEGATEYLRVLNLIQREGFGARMVPPGTPTSSQVAAYQRNQAIGAERVSQLRPEFRPEQTAVMVDRRNALRDLERDTAMGIGDANRRYGEQAANTLANYNKIVAREAEDFGRQRVNAERKLQLSILDVHQDSARQRVKWEADLARSIAKAQADSADREIKARTETAERIAEARQATEERIAAERVNAGKRLAEIEANQQKDRERATRDHRRSLMDAVSRLDAVAIRDEQRRFADEQKDREEANRAAVDQEKQRLNEFIAEQEAGQRKLQQQEAGRLQKQLAEEAQALEKSIGQQREAHALRLTEQAENDRLRIDDMRRSFEEQKHQEDIERGIRLQRQAADHAAQLGEMARQHGEDIEQIKRHAQNERDEIDRQYEISLAAVGIKTAAFAKEQERVIDDAIRGHMRFWEGIEQQRAMYPGHPSLADPYVDRALPPGAAISRAQLAPAMRANVPDLPFTPLPPWTPPAGNVSNSHAVNFSGDVHVTIAGSTNMGRQEMYDVAYEAFADALESMAPYPQ